MDKTNDTNGIWLHVVQEWYKRIYYVDNYNVTL